MKDGVQLVEAYFRDLRDIRQTGGGVKEESYYGSLEKLLNSVGKSVKPQVRCIIQLINRGAGLPDSSGPLGNAEITAQSGYKNFQRGVPGIFILAGGV